HLPRLRTALTLRPCSSFAQAFDHSLRNGNRLTRKPRRRRPTNCGRNSRTTVSTSGSSGTGDLNDGCDGFLMNSVPVRKGDRTPQHRVHDTYFTAHRRVLSPFRAGTQSRL